MEFMGQPFLEGSCKEYVVPFANAKIISYLNSPLLDPFRNLKEEAYRNHPITHRPYHWPTDIKRPSPNWIIELPTS